MVECKECGKEAKALSAHLRVHGISLVEYKEKHKDPITGELPPVGWVVSKTAKLSAPPSPPKQPSSGAQLNGQEQKMFDERVQVLFLQAEEDPALKPSIDDLVLGEIFVSRYQREINRISSKLQDLQKNPQAVTHLDLQFLDMLDKKVRDTQRTNLNLLESLNLTRKSKQKTRQVIESTPSRLVSALETYLEGHSPEMIRRQEAEIHEAEARIERNRLQIMRSISQPVNESSTAV